MTPNASRYPQYQVEYIVSNAPRCYTLDTLFVVREMTEFSARVTGPSLALLQAGQSLEGILLFAQGDSYRIAGEVESVDHARAVIQFAHPLDLKLLHREQEATAFASDRRQFFRLRYDAGEGPAITINATPYDIIELSERGIVFRLALLDDSFATGQPVTGILHLDGMDSVSIAGTVLRVRTAERVVQLSVKGIPPQAMLQEQKRVLVQRHLLV